MATRRQGRLTAFPKLSAFVLIVASTLAFPSWSSSPSELKGVSSEISRQRQALTSQQKKLDSLQQSLKKQELGIVRLEKEIKEAKSSLSKTNASIASLEKKIASLKAQRQQQSEKLAELLQTYYVTQRAKSSASILNQGVEEDRISQYFQHLAKQRALTIEELETTVNQLAESETQLKLEKQQITKLIAQQNQKRQQLTKEQTKRKGT